MHTPAVDGPGAVTAVREGTLTAAELARLGEMLERGKVRSDPRVLSPTARVAGPEASGRVCARARPARPGPSRPGRRPRSLRPVLRKGPSTAIALPAGLPAAAGTRVAGRADV